jgi:serine/threonine protein kinase
MERIGRYEIIRELGRGGFGRVYLANDPLMKCEVAIKVLSHADDPEMLARFRDEAAATRRLNHESIVTIYDVGEEQGVPYIVMEYLQGMDLQKLREQNLQLSLIEKVRILSQIAAGLQVAHENGIIHRDVKPANIMVLKNGSVKIMDFGIARLNREGATHHTRTGVVVGTLQYIPPEQFEGHAVDPMADLWAFGVIAFQMFSGRNLFEGAETPQVIYNITNLQIPDIHQLNPDVPEDLCQVVRKLLMRDRSARYQTFEDLRVDLNPMLESLAAEEANRLVDQARVIAARGELQGAHQIVRQVLERHPSNSQAKQIRDHIIAQIRASEVSKQVQELLKKGDQDFSAGSYEEAVNSYRQASRLSPGSSTVQMRMERAQQMAERARRIREEMNEAHARLTGGNPKEAQRILAGVLAEDPDNAEAAGLMSAAQHESRRQDDVARADAIVYGRYLAAQQQFTQAIEVLATFARTVGDGSDLQQAMKEVRQAETAALTQARLEGAVAKASEHARRGEYATASLILAPLAAEFPTNADIEELLKFVDREEARLRRMTDRHVSQEKLADPQVPLEPSPQATKAEAERVIGRALQMSREHERSGRISEAVHVLDVALTRYPNAAELVNERVRLLAPKPVLVDPAPRQGSEPPSQVLVPSLASPKFAPPSRRTLWAGCGVAAVLLCAGLGYQLFIEASSPGTSNTPSEHERGVARSTLKQLPVKAASPGSAPEPLTSGSSASEATPRADRPVKPLGPALASLLPSNVSFVYRKGDPSSEKVWTVDRASLRAMVLAGSASPSVAPWLAAKASAGRVIIDIKAAYAAFLPAGLYAGTVQVASNQEEALVHVTLRVMAERVVAEKHTPRSEFPSPPVTSAQNPETLKTAVSTDPAAVTPAQNPETPKTAAVVVPAVKKPYNGPKRGTANWSGLLAAGAHLVLGESHVIEGGGALTGNEIPSTDVRISITFPPGLEIQPLPAQRIMIKNSTGVPVSQIRINWFVK